MIRGTCLLVALLATLRPVSAHQVDEYLQATRLDLSPQQIVVELSLTPGQAIASQVLSRIDLNGNQQLDVSEMAAYASAVVRDLTLTIDGRPCLLTVLSVESSVWDTLSDGNGAIRLRAVSTIQIGAGRHHIEYVNEHSPAVSAYLVNALKPANPALMLAAPQRDVLQQRFWIDVEMTNKREMARRAAITGIPVAMLLFVRWRIGRTRARRLSPQSI